MAQSTGVAWSASTLDEREAWAVDVIVADLDGDGGPDILSGDRWYRAPDWAPEPIPDIAQVIAAVDVDGDGQLEVIATRGPELTARLCWTKRAPDGRWSSYDIGEGGGDWPHGVAMMEAHPVLGRALVTSYHERGLHPPEVWGIPNDPRGPWIRSTLADLTYSEEIIAVDLDGDGHEDLVAGPWWLEYVDGTWVSHRVADESYANVSRVRVVDLNGDGRLDIILTEETGDWDTRDPGLGRITWFEQPEDPRLEPWTEHVIAWKKCPHSLDVVDIDGDGRIALLVGEHDAFTPDGESIHAELLILRPTDRGATTWSEEVVDTRFEHFDGAKAIRVGDSVGIVSHGWKATPRPLVLWTRSG